MSATIITDGIDSLSARPLDWPGGWEIAFRSIHAGMHHQLYANGALVEFMQYANPDETGWF